MVKLSDIDLPMIFENRLLFSHGFHNNLNILPEEVNKSLSNTNWTDQRNRSLFFSHHDRDAQKWVGRINNPRIENGELYGDLEIHDADLALKIGPGRAPIGVSAEIRWPMQYTDPTNFSYKGFAMVPNPEVPETMLNFSKAKEDGFNSATLHTPFTNESTTFSEEVVEDIEEIVDPDKDIVAESVGEKESVSVESEEAKDEKAEVEDEQDESNLMSAERGLNKIKMENNAKKVEDEVKEIVEDVKEEEEVVEVEEEAKADFSAYDAKFEALESEIKSLKESFAKFSEAAEAEVEEVVEEEKEEEVEEVKEEVKEVEEKVEEEAKADFSQALADKIDKLADAISKKEAAPMSTAEFGNKVNNKEDAVIDRLTNSLSK